MDLAEATAADFAPHLDSSFHVADGPSLTLTAVEEKPGPGTTFSLVFHGPTDALLPQAIYRLEHETLGALDLFLVPIGRTADALVYEAVFSRM